MDMGVFAFRVCCTLITPGEMDSMRGSSSWFDSKFLKSKYSFVQIFVLSFADTVAPRGMPSVSVT
jgi:hypothetical protein